MSGIKGKSGTYKRKPRYNKYVDCGDYYEIIIEDVNGNERCRTKIDREDLYKVKTGKWSDGGKSGYPIREIKGKMTLLHWVVMGKRKGYVSDHINGDKLDNRKENLRFVTVQQNMCNRSKMKGVYISNYYKNKKQKKWVAHIIYKEKFHYLGIFDKEGDAIEVRKLAEIKYFGDFRRKT